MAFKTDTQRVVEKAREEAARAASMNFGPMPFWKPKKGKNRVRIMPPYTDEGENAYLWWREIWAHWGVGPDDDSKKNVSCPKMSPDSEDKECPICDYVEQLKASGDPADLALAKEIRSQRRIYTNIIDLKDPVWNEAAIEELRSEDVPEDKLPEIGDPKIQVWNFGVKIFNVLLDYYTENIDMVDLKEGYNVVLTRSGEGLNTSYITRLEQKPSRAPCEEDPTEKLHNLDSVMQFKTSVELQAVLEGVDPDEAKKLEAATKQQEKAALPAASKKAKPAAQVPKKPKKQEEQSQEEPESEDQEQAAEGGNGVSQEPFPTDDEGYFCWDLIADEQIEDPINGQHVDEGGTPIHISCFGAARQRDGSVDCQQCPLFDRCGERIAFLDAEEEKKKKVTGKKGRGPGKKKTAKKTAGKKVGKAKPSPADELQAEMEAAVTGKR